MKKINALLSDLEDPEFVFVKDDIVPSIKLGEVGGLTLVARWVKNEYVSNKPKQEKRNEA